MRINNICHNGSKNYNEDYAFANNSESWVIDSATGLTNSKITDYPSDGCWFSAKGDATILIKLKDGTVKIIKDTSLEKLDNKAIYEMVSKRNNLNLSYSKARESVNDTLIKHRLMKNTPNGYYTLEFNKEAINHSIEGSIDINLINSILVMSDGFSCISDSYNKYSYTELFEVIEKNNIEFVYNEIRQIEDEDYDAVKYPRFKKGDDSSCIYINLE